MDNVQKCQGLSAKQDNFFCEALGTFFFSARSFVQLFQTNYEYSLENYSLKQNSKAMGKGDEKMTWRAQGMGSVTLSLKTDYGL